MRRSERMSYRSLEPRQLLASVTLADGLLNIVGTDADDTVTMEFDDNDNVLILSDQNEIGRFPTRDVTAIEFRGLDGDDSFTAFDNEISTGEQLVTGQQLVSSEFRALSLSFAARRIVFENLESVSFYGGDGNDELDLSFGAPFDFSGNDPGVSILAIGGAGDDSLKADLSTLSTHSNSVEFYGNEGDDTLQGASGGDVLVGGDGIDTIDGGAGEDVLRGSAGDDTIEGGQGNDELFGGDGNDTLSDKSTSSSVTFTFPDSDRLYGGDGDDTLNAGEGDDFLYGGRGDDTVNGGTGDDTLYGWFGEDTLIGGAGDDRLYGGAGNDTLSGDQEFTLPRINVTTSTEPTSITPLEIDGDLQLTRPVETNDLVIEIPGESTEDGADILVGGAGDDRLYGGAQDDRLIGGNGDDLLLGEAGNDFMSGNAGADTLGGGLGNDRMYGGIDNDTIFGGGGADLIVGNNGHDRLYGEGDRDRIFGSIGRDRIRGGQGNDFLDGGGFQLDTISGDEGNDMFVRLTAEGSVDDIFDDYLEGTDSILEKESEA